jgi:hypothetical protein
MINRTEFTRTFARGRRLTTALAGMTALAVATLGFTSAAGAAGTAPTLVKPPAGLHSSGIRFGANASPSVAGFQVSPSGGLASASATFTVPTATCTPTDDTDGAVVFDGVYTETLESYALIQILCQSGTHPTYDYFVLTEAGIVGGSGVAPGDVVVTSLFQSATSTYAEIHDLTADKYWFTDNSANQGDTGVDIGTYSQTFNGNPVPTFAKVTFTNATVNGDYLGFESPAKYNALNGGDLLIKTGGLTTTGAGSSFTEKFKHAM